MDRELENEAREFIRKNLRDEDAGTWRECDMELSDEVAPTDA